MTIDRRSFLKMTAGAGAAGVLYGCASTGPSGSTAEVMPKTGRRVVVVGGGYGGTIAAKYIRMMDKSIEVVLVERNDHFVSCPFSNLYIGGLMKDLSPLTIRYDKLVANHGVKLLQAEVTAVDAASKTVVTSKGTLKYDHLALSPGIDFRTEEVEGYDIATTPEVIPHAWKAGPQTVLLRRQLEACRASQGGKEKPPPEGFPNS